MPIILNGTTGITTPGITNTGPFTFQGVVELPAGAVGAPSLTTTGDTNTGMFFPAADTIAFAEGGVEALRINSSAQIAVNTAGTAGAPVITKTDDLNTGIFFPAADTIAFAEGGVESARFDSAGNFGLGVTPSAWASGEKAFQIIGTTFGGGIFASGSNVGTIVGANAYYSATGYKRINAAATSVIQFAVGETRFLTAGSSTADSAISFTQAMTLDASGNLGINSTSPSAFGKVVVQVAGTTTPTNLTNVGPSSINLYAAGNGGSTDSTMGIFGWNATTGIGSGIGFVRENGADWGTQIRFYTHPTSTTNIGDITERARITSNGDLLVGTASATYSTSGRGLIELNGSSESLFALKRANGNICYIHNYSSGIDFWNAANTFIRFGTNGTERARITSDGYFLFGCTSTPSSSVSGLQINAAGSAPFFITGVTTTSQVDHMRSFNPNGQVGALFTNGNTFALYSASDVRRKKDIQEADDSGSIVDAIRVVKHNWKESNEHTRYGFIAQELINVYPEAVKKGDDGEEVQDIWGVSKETLVPLLVKEIQSLRARLAAAGI